MTDVEKKKKKKKEKVVCVPRLANGFWTCGQANRSKVRHLIPRCMAIGPCGNHRMADLIRNWGIGIKPTRTNLTEFVCYVVFDRHHWARLAPFHEINSDFKTTVLHCLEHWCNRLLFDVID